MAHLMNNNRNSIFLKKGKKNLLFRSFDDILYNLKCEEWLVYGLDVLDWQVYCHFNYVMVNDFCFYHIVAKQSIL